MNATTPTSPFQLRNLTDIFWWLDRMNWLLECTTRHFQRFWWVWTFAVLFLWTVAHYFYIGINFTESLPWRVAIVKKWDHTVNRGDVVAFRWNGGGPYPAGLTFTKIVKGVAGDVVTLQGRDFYVNGEKVATAKERSRRGVVLEAGPTGVIPPGRFFVWTSHPDSLDSRYAIAGWIDVKDVVGKAVVVF